MPEDFDSVVAARFKVLDDIPVPDTWERVRLTVLEPTSARPTEENVTVVDLESSTQTPQRQKPPTRLVVAGLLAAAAAVVAILLVSIRDEEAAPPVDQPPTTVTAPATPRALFGTPQEELAPGTYFVDTVDGAATPKISVLLGDGWSNSSDGWSIVKEGTGNVSFSRPDRVFSDACHATEGFHPGPLTSVDGLATALTEQGGWAEVTDPREITIDGYVGKTFQRTAPAEFTDCSRATARFKSWENDLTGGDLGWSFYEPDEVETLRVLDVNGTIIIINARLKPDHEGTADAELDAVLNSISIEPV
jgi:hypothetical protein